MREVLAEGPARRSARRSQAHDVAKSILYVLEPRVACVGHRSPEQSELRRSSCGTFLPRFQTKNRSGRTSTKIYSIYLNILKKAERISTSEKQRKFGLRSRMMEKIALRAEREAGKRSGSSIGFRKRRAGGSRKFSTLEL